VHRSESAAARGWRQAMDITPFVFYGFFFLDAIIRMIAMGTIADKRAYFRKAKNQIDFSVTVLAFVVELNEISNWGAPIRWLRAVVFLRLMTRVRGLTLLARTMAEAIPQLSLMLIMAMLILVTASIFGVHMWNDLFRNKCYDARVVNMSSYRIDDPAIEAFTLERPPFIGEGVSAGVRSRLCARADAQGGTARECNVVGEGYCGEAEHDILTLWNGTVTWIGGKLVSAGSSLTQDTPGSWPTLSCARSPTNIFPHEKSLTFDTIGFAFLLMFQVITLSSWSQVLYLTMDVDTSYLAVPVRC
jgi:hypothetical protein